MLICMAGFPWAGKSTFVSALVNKLAVLEPETVDPKSYYLDEGQWDIHTQADKNRVAIAAWDACMDYVYDQLAIQDPKQILIFDSAGSNFRVMQPLFEQAKRHNHHVAYVVIACKIDDCFQRSKGLFTPTMAERYRENFALSVCQLKKQANSFWLINNSMNDMTEIDNFAVKIAIHVLKIWQTHSIAC